MVFYWAVLECSLILGNVLTLRCTRFCKVASRGSSKLIDVINRIDGSLLFLVLTNHILSWHKLWRVVIGVHFSLAWLEANQEKNIGYQVGFTHKTQVSSMPFIIEFFGEMAFPSTVSSRHLYQETFCTSWITSFCWHCRKSNWKPGLKLIVCFVTKVIFCVFHHRLDTAFTTERVYIVYHSFAGTCVIRI